MVVLVHELCVYLDFMAFQFNSSFEHSGNLRTELQNLATCDLNIEKSYLVRPPVHLLYHNFLIHAKVDFSKQIINWVTSMGYSLIDINLYPKASAPATTPMHKVTVAAPMWTLQTAHGDVAISLQSAGRPRAQRPLLCLG